MLWRSVYKTSEARDIPLPTLVAYGDGPLSSPQVLIGGFDFRAYREMSIWRRLLESEEAEVPYMQGFFLESPSQEDLALLEALVPPSQQQKSRLIHDLGCRWKELVAPESAEQAFAAVIQETRIVLMMKGAPTEDAWDAFRVELAAG